MSHITPITLSLAGFDPSAGAGILADCKTFEKLGCYSLGVVTANTIQNSSLVKDVQWVDLEFIFKQLDTLFEEFEIGFVKIGIIENFESFKEIKSYLIGKNPDVQIIWDPVLKSTSGYAFSTGECDLNDMLKGIALCTPNWEEANILFKNEGNIIKASQQAAILLKGGHNLHLLGTDQLFQNGERVLITGNNKKLPPKHGSGCILSSAITAYLSKENSIKNACTLGKAYIEQHLSSHQSLLGWHNSLQL